MRILISGSRESSQEALNYVARVVQRIQEMGHELVVGDNPSGVDMAAIIAARYRRIPTTVFGIQETARGHTHNYIGDTINYVRAGNSYTQRDQIMVLRADIVMCVWNGSSRGTKAVYDYAQKMRVEAHLRTFA